MEEISREKFWTTTWQNASAHRIPIKALVELTYGCNFACVHCYNPTHKAEGELPSEAYYRLMDELAEAGCLQIVFTGGEPLTRKDWFEIASYAKNKGFSITLYTNATMVSPRVADQIQALTPEQVEVSIYGATPATYEKVTNRPGSYAHFLRGVELLRKRGIPLLLKMPVMTVNAHEVEAARELVHSWGIRFVYCTEIFPRVDGSKEPLQYRLSPDEVVRVNRQMVGYHAFQAEEGALEEQSCGAAQKGLFSCSCGRTQVAVTPYGQMNLCVSMPIPKYDLRSGSVAEGWKALVELVDRANAQPGPAYECPSCLLEPHCKQGPMNAYLETGSLEPCLPYFEELALLEKAARESATSRGRSEISSVGFRRQSGQDFPCDCAALRARPERTRNSPKGGVTCKSGPTTK